MNGEGSSPFLFAGSDMCPKFFFEKGSSFIEDFLFLIRREENRESSHAKGIQKEERNETSEMVMKGDIVSKSE
jgi:hypothetical protein